MQAFKVMSLEPKRSVETAFQKHGYRQGEKKIQAYFSSHTRLLQTCSNILLGSTCFLSVYDASSKIISSTPKRLLKTKILEKKTIVPIENTYGHFFSFNE